ncbi:MAG: type 2 isopentenyl-diphosphate Delta-isomerase [Saprospiraceae bacterium]|nr:type 2 isopentenyl-diphosphate Delta-isomerase [Saprospiraceae bacterium]
MQDQDPTASSRKNDHIALAFESQTPVADDRFEYEPLFSGNTPDIQKLACRFVGFDFGAPLWVSSMTGGTEKARHINRNLAAMCQEFGLGMGLGSCRSLLYDDRFFEDFNVRPLMVDRPLYANLGIAQIEALLKVGEEQRMVDLVGKLSADGLIVHINPLQEWFQPEGDRYTEPPLKTIELLLNKTGLRLIVKEVGHGMGPASLAALMQLPLDAIEFAAFGGTNFSKLEMMRDATGQADQKAAMAFVGHTAAEMVTYVNEILEKGPVACQQVIISGGVNSFLDGISLVDQCKAIAIYGQASAFLKQALGSYEQLQQYARTQIEGMAMARQFLKHKNQGTNG